MGGGEDCSLSHICGWAKKLTDNTDSQKKSTQIAFNIFMCTQESSRRKWRLKEASSPKSLQNYQLLFYLNCSYIQGIWSLGAEERKEVDPPLWNHYCCPAHWLWVKRWGKSSPCPKTCFFQAEGEWEPSPFTWGAVIFPPAMLESQAWCGILSHPQQMGASFHSYFHNIWKHSGSCCWYCKPPQQ